MATLHGYVLDATNPAGRPDPRILAMCGANGGRLVAFNQPDFVSYATQLHQAQMEAAFVFAGESGFVGVPLNQVKPVAAQLTHAIVGCGYTAPTIVLGNEQDGYLLGTPDETPSSWQMEPAVYGPWFAEAAAGVIAVAPNARLVLGSYVAGQDWVLGAYLAEVRKVYRGPIQGYDLHPYGKTPSEVMDSFALYDRHIEPGMWGYILEWNRPAVECGEMIESLGDTNWCFMCWSDGMVPPLGALDTGGWPKGELREISRMLP